MVVARFVGAALLVAFCGVVGASCVAAQPAEGDASADVRFKLEDDDDGSYSAPSVDPGATASADEGGGGPNAGPSASQGNSSSQPQLGNVRYYECVLVKNGPKAGRVIFCGGLPSDPPELRPVCYSHLNDNAVRWQNYCYDTFYNE